MIARCFLAFLIYFMALCVTYADDRTSLQECFQHASDTYRIDKSLLLAVAKVESNFNTKAINININGTKDFGIMQINSSWLPMIAKWGIDGKLLLDNPCLNVHVGAWILSRNFYNFGLSWRAVGAYNAGASNSRTAQYNRAIYVNKIKSVLYILNNELKGKENINV